MALSVSFLDARVCGCLIRVVGEYVPAAKYEVI